jgi:hypothetical protein
MRVRDLIKELKKMPQNMEVAFSAHDNNEWENQGYSSSVRVYRKEEYREQIEEYRAQIKSGQGGDSYTIDIYDDSFDCVIVDC